MNGTYIVPTMMLLNINYNHNKGQREKVLIKNLTLQLCYKLRENMSYL